MDKPASHETHEEKRQYPRIAIDAHVDILYKDNQLVARIHDISPDGLQIRFGSETLQKINPDNEIINEETAPLLDVTFHLKLYETDTKINALCKVYYLEQLPDEDYDNVAWLPDGDYENVVCGLKFMNVEGEGSKQIDAFIAEEITSINY